MQSKKKLQDKNIYPHRAWVWKNFQEMLYKCKQFILLLSFVSYLDIASAFWHCAKTLTCLVYLFRTRCISSPFLSFVFCFETTFSKIFKRAPHPIMFYSLNIATRSADNHVVFERLRKIPLFHCLAISRFYFPAKINNSYIKIT